MYVHNELLSVSISQIHPEGFSCPGPIEKTSDQDAVQWPLEVMQDANQASYHDTVTPVSILGFVVYDWNP